ncbi:hypothetical protein OQX61_17025 [Pedobacter sp. PLR]|uniref:hypothetical protein n=1 Tax=Pedobacter sp. PLR TaxID=2994465 RepID=UPI0022481829|nr:hypothetical protein [Pedobacter sp. PLR]MCX2452983.1 hypothetical protein [Pedobacter sp. PLR]
MIIYNITWLKHLIIQDQMKKAHRANNLNAEELQAVLEKYPVGFHSSNLFLRIGLFLVTTTLTSFAFGFLSLVLSNTRLMESPGYFAFLGVLCYIALEIAVRTFHHYKSGVDDALMWTSGMLLLTALYIFLDKRAFGFKGYIDELMLSGLVMLLGTYFTLRFANMVMALVSFCAFIAFIFFAWNSYGFYPFSTMPFLIIIIAATIYSFVLKLDKKHWMYKDCLGMLQFVSLLTLYAAGNYFVVRELGSSMNKVVLAPDQDIPFGWFFWLWTFCIPFIYIGIGLKRKDVILLRAGLILVAAACFTLKRYHHVASIEVVLVASGALLLGISYGLMRYLETPKYGFTVAELDDDHMLDNLKVESLIVSGTFGDGPTPPEGSRMGGGSFGGGGATSDF